MFSEFIRQKGVGQLAEVCGVARPTVYGWKRVNHIPRAHWDALMARWPALRYSHLRDMEAAAKRPSPPIPDTQAA